MDDSLLDSLTTFKDIFIYLSKTLNENTIIIIDEFPFLSKKMNIQVLFMKKLFKIVYTNMHQIKKFLLCQVMLANGGAI